MRDPALAPPAPRQPWPLVLWLMLGSLVVAVAFLTWQQHIALLFGPRVLLTIIRAALAGSAGVLLLTWLEIEVESRAG